MSEPPEDVKSAARADLARVARTNLMLSTASIGLAALGAFAAATLTPPGTGSVLIFTGVQYGALHGIAWRQAVMATRALTASTPRAANFAGWRSRRPLDGCNYAVFFTAEDRTPDLVVHLPLRRRDMVSEAVGWFYGSTRPSLLGGVALVGRKGLLATGRVVPERSAREKWARNPARWAQRLRENWLPPVGE